MPAENHQLHSINRRNFLSATGAAAFGSVGLSASTFGANSTGNGKAKSTILFFLSGGASHIDMWDMKPNAPKEYRGEFSAIETSAPGVRLCEHLPLLAKQAHHLAVINSLGHYRRGTGDHHAGYYYNLTGHAPDPSFRQLLNNRKPRETDWPFIGSVVAYKRKPHAYLPSLITLPSKPGAPLHTRPGQFSAKLGLEYDPVYLYAENDKPQSFTVPSLKLIGDITVDRINQRRDLLASLDQDQRLIDRAAGVGNYNLQQEKAFSLLCSPQTKAAFDISKEPEALKARYGKTVNGMSLLMARRLVEAGVPYISVFWKGDPEKAKKKKCASGGGWDTHGNNFQCLKEVLLPEFDQAFSALLEDLSDKNLLSETLVHINSEMGRKPKVGDPRSGGAVGAGRDHWTHCQTVLFAGGGIQGGQTFGSTDKVAEYPADQPVAPEDIAKTIYHAMGIDNLDARDRDNRPFSLLDRGEPITALF